MWWWWYISDGIAVASADDDVALICIDGRRGKLLSVVTLGYAEAAFNGDERCCCCCCWFRWFGLCGGAADFWFSSSESSRSRLFELAAGLAAGTSKLPAIVRPLIRSLKQLV